jgi:Tol biopolymer transport system component
MRRLTSSLERDEVSSASADGNHLVFTVSAAPTQVWTLEMNGGRPRALTSSNFHKTNAEISPDGLQVAYRANDVRRRTIFVTPFSGGSERTICEECGFPFIWLTDNRHLLFSTTGARSAIHILDSQTGAKTPFLSSPDGGLSVLRPSPDGRWIAVEIDRPKKAREVFLVQYLKDNPPAFEQWVRLPFEPADDRKLAWSPDSRTIYFTSLRDGYRCLWALPLDPVTKRPAGSAFAVRHFHTPTLRVESRSIAALPGALIASLEERASSIFLIPSAPH